MLIEWAAGLGCIAMIAAITAMLCETRRAQALSRLARQRGERLKYLRDNCSIRNSRGRIVPYRSAPIADQDRAEQPK